MIRSAVTISLVPEAKGGPFVFWGDLEAACEQAAAIGFDAVEVFAPSADAIEQCSLDKALERHRLKCAALGSGAGWMLHRWHLTHSDASTRARARDFIRRLIDVGTRLGAPVIVGSMQGQIDREQSRKQALAWLAEGLSDLGEHARQQGCPLLFEPLNRYETNVFNRIAETVEFLGTLSTQNIKVLGDLFHMNIEEASLSRAIEAADGYVGHVHFVDSNRRAAGFGHIDFGPVIQSLRKIGYEGYLSAEALPLPDSAAAAKKTLETFRRYVGAES